MIITAISDTHEQHWNYDLKIPKSDVLIHSGDMTMGGAVRAVASFINWFKDQPATHKVLIAGNHDFCFQGSERDLVVSIAKDSGVIYLEDQAVEINGVKFWGSPWQPWHNDWAFNLQRGKQISRKWKLIPDDTNVLITHGPPMGILDRTKRDTLVGCEDLGIRIRQLKKLKAHIFGHIHESYGTLISHNVRYVNACSSDLRYHLINEPITFEV